MTRLELRKNDIDNELVTTLSKKLNLDKVIVRVLIGRNLNSEEKIINFLNGTIDNLTNPYLYTGMNDAVKRIKKAIEHKEKILIYGDYDCDGIGAISILYLALKDNGIIADYYIPVRADEGYGLNVDAIDKIVASYAPNLIITVDLGITSNKEVEYIKKLGMDIIVTDHHQCGEILPDCIIVNPCLDSNLTMLCGAGVAFMLTYALFGINTASNYIDICAISTVADMVPLVGDNRIITKYGILNIKKGRCRKGIKQLLFTSNIKLADITTSDIGYKIAPRLNASGRLNSAYKSLSVLIEDDLTAINMLVEELEFNNRERQQLNTDIYNEAKELLKNYDFAKMKIIVLEKDDWNEGVIGIVASKIVQEFHKPTILFTLGTDGYYKGSARSISGVNIHELLVSCKKHLIRFGGHAMAAGCAIEKSSFDAFREQANYFMSKYSLFDLENCIKYDAELPIISFDKKLFDDLMKLEPYGQGNHRPLFLDTTLNAKFNRISTTNHIKMSTRKGEIIYFNGFPQIDYYNGYVHKVVYTIDRNYFNGREYNQFRVIEIIPNGIIPQEQTLLKRYLATYVEKYYKTNDVPCEKNGDKPTLYIAFNGETYKNFTEKNCEVKSFIFYTNEISGLDGIVLSPAKFFPFEYYNKIVVLDVISDTYLAFLQSKVTNVEVKMTGYDFDIRSSIESLREDYIFILRTVGKSYKFVSEYDFYKYLVSFGYLKDYKDFLASFYTFIDLELLKIGNNDIIIVINKKVDLLSSAVFKYISRE